MGPGGYLGPYYGLAMKAPLRCKVHPKYRAVRPPTSKKPSCTCAKIWAQKKAESV